MTQITLNQLQTRLLNVASIVDGICQKHSIPLYMTVGTMLGAVRHKGFIPWDDDMDFAVPYDCYPELIEVLKSELPDNLRFLTLETSETYKIPWIKVEDKESLVVDRSLELSIEEMPGLTIDIFPLVSCEKNERNNRIVRKISRWLNFQSAAYSKAWEESSRLKVLSKKILHILLPYSHDQICRKIEKLISRITPGPFYINPVDPVYKDKYFPKEWFEPLTRYSFENTDFLGVSDYDRYLKCIYNDYMQLPPIEKRRVHCDNVFLR